MTAVMIIIIMVMVMVMEGPPTLIITPAHRIEQNLGNRGQTQGPDILVKIYLTWGRRRRVEKVDAQDRCYAWSPDGPETPSDIPQRKSPEKEAVQ